MPVIKNFEKWGSSSIFAVSLLHSRWQDFLPQPQ